MSDISLSVFPGSLITWKRVSNAAVSLSWTVSSLLMLQSTESEWCCLVFYNNFHCISCHDHQRVSDFALFSAWQSHHTTFLWPTADCEWCFARQSHHISFHDQQEVSNTVPFFCLIVSSHLIPVCWVTLLFSCLGRLIIHITSIDQQRVSATTPFLPYIASYHWPTASEY